MFALLSTQKQRSTSLVNAHPTAIGRTSFDLDSSRSGAAWHAAHEHAYLGCGALCMSSAALIAIGPGVGTDEDESFSRGCSPAHSAGGLQNPQ